ncbi:MAG: glycerol-3-phosphate acyltransferase, partial [candidate division WOR-3 bacterium]
MRICLAIIFGYLFGSIPMGYILGKLRGIDITERGFRKIGTSNVYRVLGLKYAILAAIF